MSEVVIAIIGVGTTVGGVILGRYLGARSERKNQQREMIMEIYRPLIADLRVSMNGCVSDFNSSYGFIDRRFKKLQEYFTDDTIKAIEGYDSDLYLELVKIREEILPLLERIERSRMESLKHIRKDWIRILEEKETNINVVKFVDSFSASIIWEIWRENLDKVKEGYDQTMANLGAQVSNTTPPPESTLQELIDSAKKEMDKVKSMFQQVEQKFQEIEETVITRMGETIKTQY